MDIFQKNLSALQKVNPSLTEKISSIQSNERYEVFQGKDPNAINILDNQTQEFLYVNPIEDTIKKQIYFMEFKEYEFLFIYGIGNGVLIRELLKNKTLAKLILIEPEVELLYIAFHLIDFSDAILTTKVIFLDTSMLTFPFLTSFLNQGKLKFYAKLYTLHTTTPYYETIFNENIKIINKLFIKAYEHKTYTDGNDITDQFIGLKHTIINLPIMLKNPTLDTLRKQKNSNIAVIVSTGPSLYKQLETLKKHQEFITIISVDASLPILEKHGIKPDIVTSIERVELTSEFFKKTSAKFQKQIIFACASLEHPVTLKAIKGKKVLIQRPFDYNRYLNFHEYGYLGHGMSAANLAHELAITMGYKNCLLIGQDLSYGKDGTSHAKGHVLGESSDVERLKHLWIELDAYGGEGTVKSTQIWFLFKNFFEHIIAMTSHAVHTYNCTEGGVRIEGAIEKPFLETLQILLDEKTTKAHILLKNPSKKSVQEKMQRAREKLGFVLKEIDLLEKSLRKTFFSIEKFTKDYSDEKLKVILQKTKDKEIDKKLRDITKTRTQLETNEVFTKFIADIAKPSLLHYEIDLAVIKAKAVFSPADNKEKALRWIFNHKFWAFTLLGILENIKEVIEREIKEWEELPL